MSISVPVLIIPFAVICSRPKPSRGTIMNLQSCVRLLVLTIVCFSLDFGVAVQQTEHAAASDRPNILIILSDDQGYGDVSAHGNPVLKTPNLDRLRAESIRLTDFHV